MSQYAEKSSTRSASPSIPWNRDCRELTFQPWRRGHLQRYSTMRLTGPFKYLSASAFKRIQVFQYFTSRTSTLNLEGKGDSKCLPQIQIKCCFLQCFKFELENEWFRSIPPPTQPHDLLFIPLHHLPQPSPLPRPHHSTWLLARQKHNSCELHCQKKWNNNNNW